jgi:hypothetical protein
MCNKKIMMLLLLLFALVSLSACANLNEYKSSNSNTTQNSNEKVENSKDSNTTSDSIKSNIEQTKKLSIDTKSNDGMNEDSYRRETMMFHCVILESMALRNNAAIPSLAFSINYVNIITGEKKQGLSQQYFEEYYKDKNIYKVDSISKLVDYKKIETLTYDEIMKSPEKYFVKNKASFMYKQGDVLVIVHPVKDSPLNDGWIGVYRNENGKRKMVAGNF